MGWDFCETWKTRDDVVADIVGEAHVRKHGLIGDNLWCSEKHDTHVIIVLYMLGKHHDVPRKRWMWGYKQIDEGMGPYENVVPREVAADATEPVNEYARAFRKRMVTV